MTANDEPQHTFRAAENPEPEPLPLAGATIKAGFASPADDFEETPLDLNRALVRNPAATFFVRVEGDSMTGAGIDDGDLLVVDRSIEPHDGAVAICHVDGEFTVKRIRFEQEGLVLLPANPKYRPVRVDTAAGPVVWGVVRYVIKELKEHR